MSSIQVVLVPDLKKDKDNREKIVCIYYATDHKDLKVAKIVSVPLVGHVKTKIIGNL